MNKVFRVLFIPLAVVLGAWAGPSGATIVEIDDVTDPLMTVRINGVPITSAGQVVGTFPNEQDVTNFLVTPGSSTTPRETAVVGFTDFSITGVRPQFNSPQLFLTEAATGQISAVMTLFLEGFDTFTIFRLQMESDFGAAGLTCITNCVSLGVETGDFQDISAAALGNSGVTGLTFLVRSDVDPVSAVPEPVTFALLVVGLAGLGFSRRRELL